MKKGKKLMTLLLTGLMVISMSGCGVPDNQVHSMKDMKGKKIGVQLGTTGDTYVTDDFKDGKTSIERYKKGADAVQSLKQGKIDCVVIDSEPAKAFVEQNDDLKILSTEYTNEDYAIAIAKDKTDLKEKINKAIEELKGDGTLDQIIDNYVGDDTKGTCSYKSPDNVDRSNGKLTMATNAAFKPYEYYENKKIVGIDAEMAQAVADKLGMELEIVDMDFDAIINAVQSGKADIGVAGMTVNEERLQSIDFTDSYANGKQVIIVRVK